MDVVLSQLERWFQLGGQGWREGGREGGRVGGWVGYIIPVGPSLAKYGTVTCCNIICMTWLVCRQYLELLHFQVGGAAEASFPRSLLLKLNGDATCG